MHSWNTNKHVFIKNDPFRGKIIDLKEGVIRAVSERVSVQINIII
jgi:hypothetical protein